MVASGNLTFLETAFQSRAYIWFLKHEISAVN